MTTNAELTNALVAQNAEIAHAIDLARDGDELEKAKGLLWFAAPVWSCVGYGYKVEELKRRIRERARTLANDEREYLTGLRKNDKTRRVTEVNLAKLEAMEV